MGPGRVAPLLPAACQLVEADGHDGAEQRNAGCQGEQESEPALAEREHRGDQHHHGIDHADQDDVAALLQEILPALSQRPMQVGAVDAADPEDW